MLGYGLFDCGASDVSDGRGNAHQREQRREQRMQLEGVLRHSLEIDKVTEVGLGLSNVAVG